MRFDEFNLSASHESVLPSLAQCSPEECCPAIVINVDQVQ